MFSSTSVSIGRAADNDVVLDAREASKRHGRLCTAGNLLHYEDLESTNGSRIQRGGREIRVGKGRRGRSLRLEYGDVLVVAGFELVAELSTESEIIVTDGPVTVMASRADLDQVQDDLLAADPRVARRFLRFVRDTHGLTSESTLIDRIGRFVFEAFPAATHQSMVRRDEHGHVVPVMARGSGGISEPCQTVVERVLDEGVAVLFTRGGGELGGAESARQQQIETAIAAPLTARHGTFGVLQLDIRASGRGTFTAKDLELLAAVAAHVGLVLDNLRLHAEQRTALESTINALVHSLSWKDPVTAAHSRRVRDISMLVGRELELDDEQLEVLSMAATLHDMGKFGVPDEILFKPGELTEEERVEVAKHAEYTQEILDEIFYPAHLRRVPEIASWHHERIDGKGTCGIPGERLPIQARIIGACDAFDAIFSDRPYREGRSLEDVLQILTEGKDTQWDARVVDTLCGMTERIIELCYDRRSDARRAREYPAELDRRVAKSWSLMVDDMAPPSPSRFGDDAGRSESERAGDDAAARKDEDEEAA